MAYRRRTHDGRRFGVRGGRERHPNMVAFSGVRFSRWKAIPWRRRGYRYSAMINLTPPWLTGRVGSRDSADQRTGR